MLAAFAIGYTWQYGPFHPERVTTEKVAEGVWLPTRMQYDFKGRKFVFGFELHEAVEASHYRHIGGPRLALAAIRRELNSAQATGSAQ